MRQRGFLAIVLLLALLSCKSGDGGTDITITVNPGSAQLVPGESIQLTAVGTSNATWSSSNSGIATVVPQTGFVTAVARGMATISAVAGNAVATATINVISPAQIQVVAEAEFEAIEGSPDPAPQTFPVTNGGEAAFQGLAVGAPQYTAGQPTGWLQATIAGADITLRVTRGTLAFGEYTASVPVTATNAINSPQSILVTLRVSRRPSIEVPVPTIELSATPGGTATATIDVTNGGGGTIGGLSVRITGPGGAPGWLEAQLAGNTVPTTLTVTARAGLLPLGNYGALVHIESSQPGIITKVVNVALTVTPHPTIQLSRNTVSFSAPFQGAPPATQTVSITNGGGSTLSGLAVGTIAYGAGASGWLSASIDPESAPATLTLGVNQGQLAQGSYTATVPVTSPVASNSPQNVQVTMTVGPPPTITATPTSLTFGANFTTFREGPLPSLQIVGIGTTSAVLSGLSYELIWGGQSGWLDVSWRDGDTETPAVLEVRPNTTDLPRGLHIATIRVSTTTPGVPTRDIPVEYNIANFEIDVYPLFLRTGVSGFTGLPCTNCHGEFGTANGAYTFITTNRNALLCKITRGASCTTGTDMGMPASSVERIQRWLNAGAHR